MGGVVAVVLCVKGSRWDCVPMIGVAWNMCRGDDRGRGCGLELSGAWGMCVQARVRSRLGGGAERAANAHVFAWTLKQ